MKLCIISNINSIDDGTVRSFKFDHVLPPTADQPQVFDSLKISFLISRVLEGYDATILAYGQTSSGKTYTMEGYEYKTKENDSPQLIIKSDSYGIIQRSIMNIFKNIKKEKNNIKTTVSCSLIQIYNERIYDLLSKESGLKIRWTKNAQFGVENLYSVECSNAEDAITV